MVSSEERTEYILRCIEEYGMVYVTKLSSELNCSEVTIRNDIRKLDQQGLLKRVHGGAEKCQEELSVQFHPGECYWNKKEKAAIAARAYTYINSRDSIIIDDSTTCYYLAKLIRSNTDKHIIIVTNSILVAAELSTAKHVELYVLTGHVNGSPPAALDNFTIEALRQFSVSKAFIGTNGINIEKGLASLGTTQRDIKKAIVHSTNELYVLADHTKFDGSNLFYVCPMSDVTRVITDRQVRPDIIRQARELGIKIDAV